MCPSRYLNQMQQTRRRIHRRFAVSHNFNRLSDFRGPSRTYRRTLSKLLAWRLADDPFPLQIKKGSQNLRQVQARTFEDVINTHCLIRI